jgi:hypothetical protein
MEERKGHCERCARFAPLNNVKLVLRREHSPDQVCLAAVLCLVCEEHFRKDMRSIMEADFARD